MKEVNRWLARCGTATVAAYFAFGIGFSVFAIAENRGAHDIVLLPWVTPISDDE